MLDILFPRDEDTAVMDPTDIVLKLPHSLVLGNDCRIVTLIFLALTFQGTMITKADISEDVRKRFCNLK
jgi:hypothetical protein